MNREERIFDLTLNGELSLDFVNTLDWRWSEEPKELVNSYADLMRWAQHTGVFHEREAKNLTEKAASDVAKSERALKRALRFREIVYQIFEALINGQKPQASDLKAFNAELSEALSHLQIEQESENFVWSWNDSDNSFERIIWIVARSAARFLISERVKNLRVCEAPDCGWIFVDTSRTKKRRWCSMESCGNRAKARRYYQQAKARRLQK
jgi:predicted RNA-binding Zn ribbon-like protein